MKAKPDCDVPIKTGPPFILPFRTGSYLSYDYAGKDSFRRGNSIRPDFRASGSHQLDVEGLEKTLRESVLPYVQQGRAIHLIDLREESHLFFNRRAVSWYADKDWANVGQPIEWIEADEKAQLDKVRAVPVTQIFCIEKVRGTDDLVTPTGCTTVTINSSATEAMVAQQMQLPRQLTYHRMPVTDHCMPSEAALNRFIRFACSINLGDWVHFHCHGGDGRTTTFLALYDMIYWSRVHTHTELPTLQGFADRQCSIFRGYSLNPVQHCDGTKIPPEKRDWKYWLASQRWILLGMVRDFVVRGGCLAGEQFTFPTDWDQRLGLKHG